MDTSLSNPLQQWRLKSTFDVSKLRNILFTEEIVEFKNQIWQTLAKDPLFSEPDGEVTLKEKRELCIKRMKRLVEYQFVTDEMLVGCPMKASALLSALLSFDISPVISLQLSNEVLSKLV